MKFVGFLEIGPDKSCPLCTFVPETHWPLAAKLYGAS